MFRVYAVVWVVGFVMWVYCLVDSITSRDDEVRNLPKIAWIVIVLLFPLAGSIAWLIGGRPRRRERPQQFEGQSRTEFPEYDRPGRAVAADPEKDAEFLRQVRARAEEQRRAYREQQARESLEHPDSDEQPTEDSTS